MHGQAGISLGGLIVQRLAAAYPAMVDRLILIDATPRYTDDLRTMWAVRAKAARENGVSALIDGLLPIWFTPRAIAEETAAVRYVRDTLVRECPTLVIFGAGDRLISPAEGRRLADAVSGPCRSMWSTRKVTTSASTSTTNSGRSQPTG